MTRRRTPVRPNLVLTVLFTGAFVMGCAEMLVVGMLDLVAADLSVSLSAAGALVTANALGLAVGGPLLTFLTTRLDRRLVLLSTTTVFVLANLLPALGADYSVFLVARFVVGAAQGLFIAAAIVTATSVVRPERAGRAMAVVITGFAMASAVGLPVGTLLGQAVGWRGSFAAVVGIGAMVLVAAVLVIPSRPTPADSGALGQARYAFAPRVLAVLAFAMLVFAGIQSALTYLVPFLDEVSGVSGSAVSLFLLAYGVATAVGSFGGGRFADANAAARSRRRDDRGHGVAGGHGPLRRESAGRGGRRPRDRPVRNGHGAVDAAPRRQPRRPRCAARVLSSGLRSQRRHRRWLLRGRGRDRPGRHRRRGGDRCRDRGIRAHRRLGHQPPRAAGLRRHTTTGGRPQ